MGIIRVSRLVGQGAMDPHGSEVGAPTEHAPTGYRGMDTMHSQVAQATANLDINIPDDPVNQMQQ